MRSPYNAWTVHHQPHTPWWLHCVHAHAIPHACAHGAAFSTQRLPTRPPMLPPAEHYSDGSQPHGRPQGTTSQAMSVRAPERSGRPGCEPELEPGRGHNHGAGWEACKGPENSEGAHPRETSQKGLQEGPQHHLRSPASRPAQRSIRSSCGKGSRNHHCKQETVRTNPTR